MGLQAIARSECALRKVHVNVDSGDIGSATSCFIMYACTVSAVERNVEKLFRTIELIYSYFNFLVLRLHSASIEMRLCIDAQGACQRTVQRVLPTAGHLPV